MKNSSVTAFNGYPLSILLAVTMHGLVLAALLFFQRANTEVLTVERPPVVKAILVEENPQVANEQRQEEERLRRVQEQQAAQRREEERARQQQQEREEQQRQEEQRREEQRQRELEAQRQEERRLEQQRLEEQRREEERRREQERLEEQRREQQRLEEQRREQQRQEELAAQREAEARERAETDAEMIAAYTSIIHDLVQQNWSRPPSARNGMTAVLRIRMLPTGDVTDVQIVRSSGDFAFDRAAENAVQRVGRFTELQGMPTRLFNQNFRSLLLTFRPEDLLN